MVSIVDHLNPESSRRKRGKNKILRKCKIEIFSFSPGVERAEQTVKRLPSYTARKCNRGDAERNLNAVIQKQPLLFTHPGRTHLTVIPRSAIAWHILSVRMAGYSEESTTLKRLGSRCSFPRNLSACFLALKRSSGQSTSIQ